MRKVKILSVFVLLALLLSAGTHAVMSQDPPPFPARQSEPGTDASQVCSPEVALPADEEITYLQTIVPLARDEPLFETLRRSSGVQTFGRISVEHFGSLLWDQATLATYQNTDAQALLIPIESAESSHIRFLVTYYSEETGPTRTVIFEISPAPTLAAEHGARDPSAPVAFSGVISYYTPDGRLISSATFEENELISTKQEYSPTNAGRGPGLQAPAAGYWECFADCLECAWSGLPWYWKIVCGAGCGGCLYSGGSNVPACVACAGCLIGSGVSCGMYCYQTGGYWPGC